MSKILMSLSSLGFAALLHYYVWRRLIRDNVPDSPRGLRIRRLTAWGFVCMCVMGPSTVVALRLGYDRFAAASAWVTFPWVALVGLTAMWRAVLDLLLLPYQVARWQRRRAARGGDAPTDPGRRAMIAQLAGGTALAASTGSIAFGVTRARGDHEIVRQEFALARLPAALDGFRIVQLTDLHVGLTIDRAFVQRVVDRAMALKPDLVVLTGDLVDGSVAALAEDVAPLATLAAPHGVFAITGNHEYYAGVDAWVAHFESLGIRYLRNARVPIGSGDAWFDLVGVDDYTADHFPGAGTDLVAAIRDRDTSRALVLLAHQPRQILATRGHGVDLQLSGHTHGGQIWPWHYVVAMQQGGRLAGRYDEAGTQLYVSRGCGYWGPPVRVGAPLEITEITLRRRQAPPPPAPMTK